MALLDTALMLAGVPALLASTYLLILTLLSARKRAPVYPAARHRFVIVVPAHDEEAGIAATVKSLLSLDYPSALRRIIVVADNCTDATRQRAVEAGAEVLVRDDPLRRGKGYALAFAFERILAEGFADALVVVDADTLVSDNLLHAFAVRLDDGAGAIQARYEVRNRDESWRTRATALAFVLFHRVRSLGRERLGCSAGLRGNGMCFGRALLRDVPYDAFSIVEDLEYGIRLALNGHRVHYADEAVVLGDMPAAASTSRSQRRRWEGGRFQVARLQMGALLRRSFAARDRVALDGALDLAVPPLAYLAASAVLGVVASLGASWAAGRTLAAFHLWTASLVALVIYVARGWSLSGLGLRGVGVLLRVPLYLAWKVAIAVAPDRSRKEWVRTPRQPKA